MKTLVDPGLDASTICDTDLHVLMGDSELRRHAALRLAARAA